MRKSDIQLLLGYNYWATHLILDKASQLAPEQYYAPENVSYGSLHGTLVHIMAAEYAWLGRCKGNPSPVTLLTPEQIKTYDELVARWQQEEAAMRAFLDSLTDDDLDKRIHYTRQGKEYSNILWQILSHVVTHGMQHRAECAMLLTNYGYSPGDIDLIVYVRLQEQ